jgi:hypothetical protein
LPVGDREEERKAFMENKYKVLVTTKDWLERSVFFQMADE